MHKKARIFLGILVYLLLCLVPYGVDKFLDAPNWFFVGMIISWAWYIMPGWMKLIKKWVEN